MMDGISYVITVYNKYDFLPLVLQSIERQEGNFARQVIVVDDGSTDGSSDRVRALTAHWTQPPLLIQQANAGPSAATNAGARAANQRWLKLVDGDDLLPPSSSRWLLEAAQETGYSFAYGDLGVYDLDAVDPIGAPGDRPSLETDFDGLARFIRCCPANSSSMLIDRDRYWQAGGCDERLVSPDQALFLRLFAVGNGVHVRGPVALVPRDAPGRLSGQKRRSRYESVLALHHLLTDTPGLSERYYRLAARRAAGRAFLFRRRNGHGAWVSRHALDYFLTRIGLPVDAVKLTRRALSAFTEDGSVERPLHWLPGAMRAHESGS
jgi:glycosyltransferase involved in cell wall biosynthesis